MPKFSKEKSVSNEYSGLALHRRYNRASLDDRQINELIGLAQGLIADNVLNGDEISYLQKWLAAHRDITNNPLISTLFLRVSDVLADKKINPEESADLLAALRQFAGGNFELGEIIKSAGLPIDKPAPQIYFEEKKFCFTGTFAYGSRSACESAVFDLGGEAGSLTLATDYLVIGIYASDSWVHSSYGRKIEKAVSMKGKCGIAIISEEHWASSMKAC